MQLNQFKTGQTYRVQLHPSLNFEHMVCVGTDDFSPQVKMMTLGGLTICLAYPLNENVRIEA